MSIYKHPGGRRFLFIHIPRTGGRFIESNLESNEWRCEPIDHYGVPHYNHSFIDDCEITHFHRELYEKYFGKEDIPHLTIIRNPIDKFFSASIYLTQAYGLNIQKAAEDESQLYDMIHEYPKPENLNWWRPQVDFLSEKTHIWRYENGLGRRFSKWLSEIIGVNIKMDAFAKYPTNRHERTGQLTRTPKLIENIKKICKQDIEQLYPELI